MSRRRAVIVGLLAAAAFVTSLAAGGPRAQANACDITQDHSISNPTPTSIKFVNSSSLTLHIYWLDYSGTKQPYAVIAPGVSADQPTYAQSAWVVIDDATGVCHGYVIAQDQPITYTIVDDPPATASPTGERAAALGKCKKAFKKNHSKQKLKKCKKRANLLPV